MSIRTDAITAVIDRVLERSDRRGAMSFTFLAAVAERAAAAAASSNASSAAASGAASSAASCAASSAADCVDSPMPPGVVVLDGVLTAAECAALIARAEAAGFEPSKHKGKENAGFRRGSRAPLTDAALAKDIFDRISHALPQRVRPESMAITRVSAAFLRQERAWGPPAGLWEQVRTRKGCKRALPLRLLNLCM